MAVSCLSASLFSLNVNAQVFCANEVVIYSENFGTGNDLSTHPDVVNLSFQALGALDDGFYRIANNTQQRPEWHSTGDHTTNTNNGKMLVVYGTAETFFVHTITNGTTAFAAGSYAASLYLLNVNTPGTCAPDPLLPTISFKVEYNTAANGNAGWVTLTTINSAPVPQSAIPTWIQLGAAFNLPVMAQRVRLTLSDGTTSGCGNDFAIDDIKFATCPSGGPLPVEFLSIDAEQKGGGVAVNWSTASEFNNKYFDLEKIINGSTWSVVNSVKGAGNSSVTKYFTSYDAQPATGYNYYRVKQVDVDGRFKYSSVVKVKINIETTGVSVLANPFVNNITVDFLSPVRQSVSVRLSDISGKLVSTEKWKLAAGSSRMVKQNISSLQRGMYIITVIDENSNVIYNNKLMKQ